MNNQEKDFGRLENLQLKINRLRQESVDPGFTQYLNNVQARLDGQLTQAMSLENELNQNYRVYLQHFGAKPVMQPQPQEQPQKVAQTQVQEQIQVEIQPQPLVAQEPQPQIAQEVRIQSVQEPQSQMNVTTQATINPQMYYNQPKKQKRNVEFTVGAGLFCILGVLFILASFVMLGITYMGGLFKGISLYVIALVVILVSELVFRKRMEKFALAMTGLGLASLYASTMINCMYLHNFGNIVAIILTVLISAFAGIMARKKDSGIIKVISFIGCYLCFLPAGKYGTTGEFVTMSIILLLINIWTILLPVKRSAKAVHITHVLSNMAVTTILAHIALDGGLDARWVLGFVITNLFTLGLVYFSSWKRGQCTIAVLVCFLIAFLAETFQYAIVMNSDIYFKAIKEALIPEIWYHLTFGFYAATVLILFLLFIKNRYRWIYYYFLLLLTFFTYGIESFDDNNNVKCIAILSVFLLSKLLSRVKTLQVSELVVSAMTLIYATLIYDAGGLWAHVFAIVILLSILFANQYKVVYQYFVTISSILYLLLVHHEFTLTPSLLVGVLFLLLFVFNNVKWIRATNQLVFNAGAVAVVIATSLLTPFISGYINTALIAVFGTAVVILMFTEKYGMNFKGKYLSLVLFWTYLAVTTDYEIQLIGSVILMIIAIVSVIMGFAISRKEVRVCGLILSVLVCFKVLFYDFSSTPIQERMLLFLIIGVIILSISFIYILLEKKIANRGE